MKYTKNQLEEMLKSDDWEVRKKVAEQGYGLEKLINDENWVVRKEVAIQRYRLDILVNDVAWEVRLEVAKHGYGLDILVNDENWRIRKIIAEQGYGLDILINDEDIDVRLAVAKQSYGLDILINDAHWRVRAMAKEMTERLNQHPKEVNSVNHPEHYNQTQFECIDEMIILFGKEKVIDWCKITAYKYKHRAGFKDDKLQDLAKADWYLSKVKELQND